MKAEFTPLIQIHLSGFPVSMPEVKKYDSGYA
jgi:hypothetical protein